MNIQPKSTPIYGPLGSIQNIYLENFLYFEKDKKYNGWDMPLHTHKFHEIYYLISGKVKFFADKKSYILEPGSVIFVPEDTLHKTTIISENVERYLINFTNPLLSVDSKSELMNMFVNTHITIPPRKRAEFEVILEKAYYEETHPDEYSKILHKQLIQEFLLRLARAQKSSTPSVQVKTPAYIPDIIQYINENYTTPISVEELSRSMYINETQLSRAFKKANGIGINEYINSLRVLHAEKLLTNTDKSITEIAYNCGFNSSSYFTVIFKSFKGITPLKFRRQLRSMY